MRDQAAANTGKLVSINQAAARGIVRLRKPQWAQPLDHIKIDIVDGAPGPWVRVFSPTNRMVNGRDPVEMLTCVWPIQPASLDCVEFEVYGGPLPDSDAYKEAVARTEREWAAREERLASNVEANG